MKLKFEENNEGFKAENVYSKTSVYRSSSDDELAGGICPCIPSFCFIYKVLLNKWKRHLLTNDSESLVLCQFKDQSNSSCMTTLAFLISEVKEVEDLLSSIELDTNIRHDRSRGKLLQLKQEIVDTLLIRPSENSDVIHEFMNRIKAYKKKLIIVNLENELNRNDNIYDKPLNHPLSSSMLLDKLDHVNIRSSVTLNSEKSSTPLEITGRKKTTTNEALKKQDDKWPWKGWTKTFSKGRSQHGHKKLPRRFSKSICGSKKCQIKKRMLGVVQSWPAFCPLNEPPRFKLSSSTYVEAKIQKECQTESIIGNKRSKANVNQGVSAQSIFVNTVMSAISYEERGTGSNSMLTRPKISRSVSAQSLKCIGRCEEILQTRDIIEEIKRFSPKIRVGNCSCDSVNSKSEEEDFVTTSCSHPSIVLSGTFNEFETINDYNISSHTEIKPSSEICDERLWYISANQLCDEMIENNTITCQ